MMNVVGFFKNAVQMGLTILSGKVSFLLRKPKKPVFPLADRLLADAFRLGQIPSPTEQEKERAFFVAERLQSLNLPYTVDNAGNILVHLHSIKEELADISSEPLLVFTRMVSERWNSLDSLGKLELQYARGAGLADALGPAALLSLAEAYALGRLSPGRDIQLFFSAIHFDDPYSDAFSLFTSNHYYRPAAAIGVRGFMLGFLTSHTLGSYRVELTLTEEDGNKKSNAVVNALTDAARHFQKTADSMGENLHIYFKRIEALSSFSRTPSEGVLELDLESADGELLEDALESIKAVAESTAYEAVKSSFRVVSSIPPGDPSVSEELTATLLEIMKELKINAEEEAKPDPSSFLSALGIPALSVGVASGREGLNRDTVEIASIEKGRQLLERLVMLLGE
jgi:acetylornithine deacetylase/succinyl-diaminopimelate desuccinylase-like protein